MLINVYKFELGAMTFALKNTDLNVRHIVK